MKFFWFIVLLVACNQNPSPADAVKKTLDGLKRLDPLVLSQLANGKDVLKDVPTQAQTILKNALGKLEYEILGTETKDNQARVTVNLKAVEVGKMADLAFKTAKSKLGSSASKEAQMNSAVEFFNAALKDSSLRLRSSQTDRVHSAILSVTWTGALNVPRSVEAHDARDRPAATQPGQPEVTTINHHGKDRHGLIVIRLVSMTST